MKLVWSPDTAEKAYIDTVIHCELYKNPSEAELISAMAAGWNVKSIMETWSSKNPDISTSIGLAVACNHTGAKHTCVVPDKESKRKYLEAMGKAGNSTEVIVISELGKDVHDNNLVGVSFLVMDCMVIKKFARVLRVVKLGNEGAVLVCKNTYGSMRWINAFVGSRRLVRSVGLPVGEGIEIVHVGAVGGGHSLGGGESGKSRWFKHFDRQSGEEHLIRKQRR